MNSPMTLPPITPAPPPRDLLPTPLLAEDAPWIGYEAALPWIRVAVSSSAGGTPHPH
jgi:hypothetical protein